MRKSYEALSVDVVKFEAQDVITASGTLTDNTPTETSGQDNGQTSGGQPPPNPYPPYVST